MTQTVTILMATRNGAAHLPAQLASLAAQTHRDWRLWVSDDGSTDATVDILHDFARCNPAREMRLLRGPCRGSAANFLTALCHPDLPPGPVALCDQDDIWLLGKLARAMRRIAAANTDGPVIYAAESWRSNAALSRRVRSRPPRVAPGFANALVQNLCSGHTIMLNEAAVALARRAGAPVGLTFHDWWLYQLVTGAGGLCLLDPMPVALYRQHGANVLGAAASIPALARRAGMLMSGIYAGWLAAHHRALAESGLLTPDAQAAVTALLDTSRARRARSGLRLGLHRDTRLGTAAMFCALALGQVET